MTALGSLLADPTGLFARLKVPVLEPKALRKASTALAATGESPTISDVDVAELQLRVAAAAKAGAISRLSRRELREACRVYLHAPHPPGADEVVARSLLDAVQELQRRAAFFSLIDVYLDRFDASSNEISYLAERLDGLSSSWPWRAADEWPRRSKAFAIFSPQIAPQKIGEAALKAGEPVRDVLLSAGLTTDGRIRGGLAEAAFRSACSAVGARSGANSVALQNKLIGWAQTDGEKLIYPRAWPDFAGALFRPWNAAEPPKSHQHHLLDAALGYGGDPRVNQARWRPVKDTMGDAYNTVVRWLTKASVEQFFDIVAQTTERADMWADRRAFWSAYLKADMISAAWVVFGADGARRAEAAARHSNDSGLSMFGRLASGGGRKAEHAALIMRIGDLTIVEWSHNGRWNVWRKGDRHHPQLFRQNSRRYPDYTPQELMHGPLWGAHQNGWQSTVRDTIYRSTGLRP